MSEYLLEKLKQYGASDFYPLHMPGHKRQIRHFVDPFAIDITEIEGFDDLHHARSILLEAQCRAARLYGAEETYYLINGSTCGILAAVAASVKRGGRILMARNSHRSCYHAAFLNDLRVTYLYPPVSVCEAVQTESAGQGICENVRCGEREDIGRGICENVRRESITSETCGNERRQGSACRICGSISPADVEEALRQNPDIEAVLVTSPTYDGVVSDIRAIAEIAHAAGAVLIVDEAHGAHFGMHPYFPEPALSCGADIVINSLHKTLPSLTQTALLHVQGNRADREKLRKYLDIYQTSSPSYVLMAGMDACVRLLQERGGELFDAFTQRLERMKSELRQKLRVLQLLDRETFLAQGEFRETPENPECTENRMVGQNAGINGIEQRTTEPGNTGASENVKSLENAPVYDLDRSKVLISTAHCAMTGPELADLLRNEYHLEPEMAAADYVTAIMTVADTQEGFDRLTAALLEIDAKLWAETGTTVQKERVRKAEGKHENELDGSRLCADPCLNIDTKEGADTDRFGSEVSENEKKSKKKDIVISWTRYPRSEEVLSIREAEECPAEQVALADSAGRISAEYVYLYPPGIPLLVPGERITEELLQRLRAEQAAGLKLRGFADPAGRAIRTVRESCR